jgi:phage repressor protein C with HTH and peptisase S24 domain
MSIPTGNLPESIFRVELLPMDKYEKRRVRLAELRDQKFHGSASDLARAIGKEPSYVSRMLYPAGKAGKKRIGEDMAEVIETALGWPKGSLDSDIPVDHLSSGKSANRADKLPLFGESIGKMSSDDSKEPLTPAPEHQEIDPRKLRRIYVIGKALEGLPAILWKDGDTPVGATDQYAELASSDPRAFICPVVGDSMFPRFMPGEYVLVQPSRPPEIEDTVLIRLENGDTMLKRLLSRRDHHVRLGAWNDPTIVTHREDEITWIYSVAHAVPAWMIKQVM